MWGVRVLREVREWYLRGRVVVEPFILVVVVYWCECEGERC